MAGRYLASLNDPDAREAVSRQHAIGRIGKPQELAGMVQFLLSDLSGFATGAAFVLDGGLSLGIVAEPE
jgi:NAD(P)-dependent dehydrogenase (short-subunit alcohol dehydrogenase family)